mgnify:CR=1 FL=1
MLTDFFSTPGWDSTAVAIFGWDALPITADDRQTRIAQYADNIPLIDLAANIAARDLAVPNRGVIPLVGSGRVSRNVVGLGVDFRTTNYDLRDEVFPRLPFLLCSLREAGFTEARVNIGLRFVETSTSTIYEYEYCIPPDVINAMNCSQPETNEITFEWVACGL